MTEGKLRTELEPLVLNAARKALLSAEVARTDVVNPVNGARPYSYAEFHGQRIRFQEGEFEINGDAGSGAAAAYATAVNDALFTLSKDAARAALEAAGVEGLLLRIESLQSHVREQITHVETRILDGTEMGAVVWRIALEDVARENRAALASQ